ncbi:MAG: PhzF family phenazine biosynthesis protein [Verrucomicrobiota bacterium]|nr:PhzF family phenazine biosynthesis protein [Verrucomicrobiota bacterium]
MHELTFHTLDVFTDRVFGGNQLAVFPEAPELDTTVMQAIAREFNLSETVFVRPPTREGAWRQLRIFTPGAELPFAGHPTVGAAQLLVELGIAPADNAGAASFAFDEGVGLVPVTVSRDATGGYFTWLTAARLPETGPPTLSREALAALLGISPGEILDDERDKPCAYSAGVPFLFVPVRDAAVLARVSVDLTRWREIIAGTWAEDVYVFCLGERERTIRARMFAPAMGIAEDPATGSAAAAFAGYLWERSGRAGNWTITQGVEMGRPSTLHVEMLGTAKLERVRVGGSAVRVSQGTMRVPKS